MRACIIMPSSQQGYKKPVRITLRCIRKCTRRSWNPNDRLTLARVMQGLCDFKDLTAAAIRAQGPVQPLQSLHETLQTPVEPISHPKPNLLGGSWDLASEDISP